MCYNTLLLGRGKKALEAFFIWNQWKKLMEPTGFLDYPGN